MRSAFDSVALAVILTMCGCVCVAASPSNEQAGHDEHIARFFMHAGRTSAREHARSIRHLTGYSAEPGECGDVMLGPLPEGRYTGEEAWLKLVESVCPLEERPGGGSRDGQVFVDMSECKCSFGLPRFTRLQPQDVLVEKSSLPMLGEYVAGNVLVLDRKRIDEIGAASIPDLLRSISQTAFHRAQGFRASGAQYAELRGLGPAYTLVLVNGRRAFGTAADLATSAFDLSNIPLRAVKRIEISMDASSLVHGMDAIGGIVNVVLNDSIEPAVHVRYGSARGGASQTHASISGGTHGDRGRLAVFFDVLQGSELLGRERDRWNNQDFTRFGGQDYRSRFASPANVTSTDGQNLPGFSAPFAAIELNPDTGMFDFVAGEQNRTSLRAFQAIIPQSSRASISANGSLTIGASTASLELLAVRRENDLQLAPSVVPGTTWGAEHPENPFGVPIRVEALMAGLPAPRQHFQIDSRRQVASIVGPWVGWEYSAFVVLSDEKAQTRIRNATDPAAIANALQANDASHALSLYGTLRPIAIPEGIFVDTPVDSFHAKAVHLQASMQGSLRIARTVLGIERRHESMDFDARVGGASRDITSTFAHVRVPLIDHTMNVAAVEDLKLLLGARRDDYSDIGAITKKQFGLIWRITKAIELRASTSDSFRPPSLVDLYFPRIAVPATMFDPRRNQAGPIELIIGGNPDLHSTTGRSDSVGLWFQVDQGLRLSADYWRVQLRDHIALSAPMSLLAHEDAALSGRIVRAPPTTEDAAAGQPGRLLLLDISRANVGGVAAQGVDLAAEAEIETGIGSFTPRLSVTLTNKFEYSDLPIAPVQMEDRAGVASEFGTIPAERGVASLTYESNKWRASVNARVISSYRDRSEITGEPIQRMVAGGALWDLNISREITGNVRLTLGAFNVTDRQPPYAHAGGSLGFDTSQGDLEGREIYGVLSGTF